MIKKSSISKQIQIKSGRIQDYFECANKGSLDCCIFKILLVATRINLISNSSAGDQDNFYKAPQK